MSQRFHIDRVQVRSTGRPDRAPSHRPETNVWLIGDDRDVVIVDPAGAPELVADAMGNRRLTAVICTHGHRAHVAAAMVLGEEFHAPVLMHSADHAAWQAVHGERRYWRLDDGQRIGIAGEEIRVLHTPTPTPGSVTLHIPRHAIAFTGDALTHQGFDVEKHYAAEVLETFAAMSPETEIHPRHGNSSPLSAIFPEQVRRFDRQSTRRHTPANSLR
ncbi:hydrolase (plasmid) [Rhodococcus erythropolis R138]|uniref:MBL fold metallo-hydrolase n=1 Tax=Rhodococcus erythropolis TaxID=1833 RepID=UPI000739264D|nr:MBL fold metallo-hydrolase [Rhodococcus erythropolis]ALU73476.1 hydrolase [Rhodococcus erythropolis R138]